jgi:hypothetical protein
MGGVGVGKQIYLTDEQLEYLANITDPCNAQEDEERDEIRRQVNDKVTRA